MTAGALTAGGAAFLLFFLYDAASLSRLRGRWLLFAAGGALLCAGVAGLLFEAPLVQALTRRPGRALLFLGLAALSLALLLKALFFSFPRADAYGGASPATVSSGGVYALCRHPGALFYPAFHWFLWLAVPCRPLFLGLLLFSLLELALVAAEDRWIFPRTLAGYDAYRKSTPFLFPTRRSVCAAFCHPDRRD